MSRSMPNAKPGPQPAPEEVVPTLQEAFNGMGGSYIFDSTTGQRTLVHQTLPPSI